MDGQSLPDLFNLTGQVAVVMGGAGVLCSHLCRALAEAGVNVAILDLNQEAANQLADEICQSGGNALAFECDVCNPGALRKVAVQVIDQYGKVDLLINGAGGNSPRATTSTSMEFFDLPEEALKWVVELNLLSTIYASQVFGEYMARAKKGVILNISSMNALRPLTRIPAYSASKAAVSNFTQWLAVHMAQEYSAAIRVNAIAPGFFLTEQNRFLVTEQDTGAFSSRGKAIIDHTPMQRFGTPADLTGTVLWLLSSASAFITGVIVPVDGGFSAFSGV